MQGGKCRVGLGLALLAVLVLYFYVMPLPPLPMLPVFSLLVPISVLDLLGSWISGVFCCSHAQRLRNCRRAAARAAGESCTSKERVIDDRVYVLPCIVRA